MKLQLSVIEGIPKIIAQESETTSGGGLSVGGELSSTVTFWYDNVVLLAESETIHVTVVVPRGKIKGLLFVTEATVQLSLEIGSPKTTPEAVHSFKSVFTIISAGAAFNGATVSETVTSCVEDTVFPATSVTVQTTGVIPISNAAGALFEGTSPPQLSVADAIPISTLQFVDTISIGTVNTGFSVSFTVIV